MRKTSAPKSRVQLATGAELLAAPGLGFVIFQVSLEYDFPTNLSDYMHSRDGPTVAAHLCLGRRRRDFAQH